MYEGLHSEMPEQPESEEKEMSVVERILSDPENPETELWASEALQTDQAFNKEEIDALVSVISDPELACLALTIDQSQGKKIHFEAAEILMEKILSDEEVILNMYMTLVESGILEDPSDAEAWWASKSIEALAETENPNIAAYLMEHAGENLSFEQRQRLEEIARA